MSKAPSMPMFWDAYLADTTHLSTEEHGAYLLLLAAMWRRNGWVPDDDRDNARILNLTVAKWRRTKARLMPFLIVDNGWITQKNLLRIWKITQEKIERNRENGGKGGRAKAFENKALGQANGSVSVKPNATIPEPEPEPEPESERKKEPPPIIPPPSVGGVSEGDLLPMVADESAPVKRKPYPSEFEEFWKQYPRRAGKRAALKAWELAMKRGEDREAIMAGVHRYAAERDGQDQTYTANPSTWLNQNRWEDEPGVNRMPQALNGKEASFIDYARQAVENAEENQRKLAEGRRARRGLFSIVQ